MKKTFKIGENNISYIGSKFKEWFGDMEFIVSKKPVTLFSQKLPRNMNDSEIQRELQPTEITLAYFYSFLLAVSKKEWFICYIKDESGVLRAVSGFWVGGGWDVDADSVEHPFMWGDDSVVLSRNSFESDTLNLSLPETLEINGVMYKKV